MAEVPDDGAHQRAVLPHQIGLRQRGHQVEGVPSDRIEHRSPVQAHGRPAGRGDRPLPPKEQPETAALVALAPLQTKTVALHRRRGGLGPIFVADLGADPLAGRDAEGPLQKRDLQRHLPVETGVDLDPLTLRVVIGDVLDRLERDVRGELAVDAGKQVAGEARGVAGGVLVSRLQRARVVGKIEAHQQQIPRAKAVGDQPEELALSMLAEVAEAGPQKGEQHGRRLRQQRQGPLVRGGERLDVELRVALAELPTGARQRLEADVHRDVTTLAARGPGVQQPARLGRRARAQLDQADVAGELPDPVRVPCQQRVLGPGLVVLGLLGDPLEQRRSLGVVQILRIQPPRTGVEPGGHGEGKRQRRLPIFVGVEHEAVVLLAPPSVRCAQFIWCLDG